MPTEKLNLPYKNLGDVTLAFEDNITDINLNSIFNKLLKNDTHLFPGNTKYPSIWECKWFNNPSVQGYNTGDCFWYNTENPRTFIDTVANDIYNYAVRNPYLKNIIIPWNRYDEECYQLYLRIANGYTTSEFSLPRLYDIGDLSGNAQIRISKVDNNKAPITDDNYYEDFFVDNIEEDAKKQLDEIVQELFDNHIRDYHFGVGGGETNINKEKYLKRDMSNLASKQDLYVGENSHINQQTGFDYIVKEVHHKIDDIQNVWFRLWNSGLLEHGGVIQSNKTSSNFSSVKFDWTYNNGSETKTAPIYSYAEDSEDFYGIYTKFDNGDTISKSNLLTKNYRYTISVSHLTDETDVLDKPDSIFNYNINEVVEIKNDGFKIKNNENSPTYYSYHVRGVIDNG